MAFKQYRILFKLVNPSIMDSEGVKMLKSIDMVFELLPISMNKVVFVKETIKKSDLMAEIKIKKNVRSCKQLIYQPEIGLLLKKVFM